MWKKSEYTKAQINLAGKKVCCKNIRVKERETYLAIIDNWRAAHAFPMNTFAIHLKHAVATVDGAIVVQRLKRLNTITGKLQRFPKMELCRMQDLGGCRVIMPTVQDVYAICNHMRKSRIRHTEKGYKDYIKDPNPNTGYRGVHMIFRYKSDKKIDYNGMLIEIQIRTKLQHLWATAVETVGVFTQNGLKFNQGSEKWLNFFKLVSALFSYEEKTTPVGGFSAEDVVSKLYDIIDELNILKKLITIGLAVSHSEKFSKRKSPGYYLMILNLEEERLDIMKIDKIEDATDEYNRTGLNANEDQIY